MIEFRLLGTLHLTDAEGREVQALLTASGRLAPLAYPSAAPPRGLRRRDTSLALFWPDLDQEHARAALRQALHVLRDALGDDVVVTRGDEDVGIQADRLWCDVAAFDRAVAAGQGAEAPRVYPGGLPGGVFIPGAPGFERRLGGERAPGRQAGARRAEA